AAPNPSTESDDAALLVADGKDQSSSKPVIIMIGPFFAKNQAGLFDQRKRMRLVLGPVHRVVPLVRRVAEAEEFDGFGGDAAFLKIIAGDLAPGLIGESGLPALGDLFMNVPEGFFEMADLLLAGLVLEFQCDMGSFGQAAHRVHESNIFVLLHE